MKSIDSYWVRTAVGLENIAIAEIKEKLSIDEFDTAHRSVFFHATQNESLLLPVLKGLKVADDVYYYLGKCQGIDNTKNSITVILKHFKDIVIPVLETRKNGGFVRITASFLGQRNFNRFYIENALNELLATSAKYSILSNEQGDEWHKGEIRIRYHIEGETAYCGLGVFDKPLHRREWRADTHLAQLHPPIATAMIRLADSKHEVRLIDPFCGSGTILIESLNDIRFIKRTGFDIDASAITTAEANTRLIKGDIEFFNQDFFESYETIDNYYIISNPPWGEKHAIDSLLISHLVKILNKSEGAILLVSEDLRNKLQQEVELVDLATTRIQGKIAFIVKMRKK